VIRARPRTACAAALLVAAATLPCSAPAQSADSLVGDWRLTLHEGRATHVGQLTFEPGASGLEAYVDGGPVPVTVNGDALELTLDYRDGGGRYLERYLTGRFDGTALAGTMTFSLESPPGTWQAERIALAQSGARGRATGAGDARDGTASDSSPRGAARVTVARAGGDPGASAPQPADLSGIWSRTSSGLAKVHLDYTPAAQAVVDGYSYLDDPALRCVSPGLVRVSGWPYPLEIVQTEDQVTILYESFHEVRRIWLDGREIPEDVPNRAMGYSFGHWEGATLVVETDRLASGFMDLNGQPISDNARVVERMWLEDGGQTLKSELVLHDPEHYARPVPRTRAWRKTPDTVILEYDCDPYPFFRGLELEGKLEEYWQRMRQRR
jgi:hypothetical protein